MTYQQTMIIGNLGSDPELKTVNGQDVCNFSVAVSEKYTDRNGERVENTTWYRVAAWGKLAATCNTYLSKGRPVMAIGNVTARAYIDKNGEAVGTLELRALTVRFLSGGQRDSSDSYEDHSQDTRGVNDIPF